MAEGQLDIIRRAFDAFIRRDFDALAPDIAEDFEFKPLMSVWQRPYVGGGGLLQWWQDLDGLWESFEIHVGEYRPVRDGVVVVLGAWHAVPRGSGMAAMDAPIAGVLRMSGEKLSGAEFFMTEAEAVSAATR